MRFKGPSAPTTAMEAATSTAPTTSHTSAAAPSARYVMLYIIISPHRWGRRPYSNGGSGAQNEEAKSTPQCHCDIKGISSAPHTHYAAY